MVGPITGETCTQALWRPTGSTSARSRGQYGRDGRTPYSLHSYFLRGQPDAPLELVVERIRDGQAFSTCRVTAVQDGTPIMALIASFHIPEVGNDWQIDIPRMIVPEEDLEGKAHDGFRAFWLRVHAKSVWLLRHRGTEPPHPVWVRAVERLDPAAIVDACALIYITDMNLVASAASTRQEPHHCYQRRPCRMATPTDRYDTVASVERAIRFQLENARGLCLEAFHSADGTLVASIAQEALLRPIDPEGSA